MRFKPAWDLIRTTFAEWWNDNTFRLAASLAFYTIFSLAPVLVIAVFIAELVVDNPGQAVATQFESLVGREGGRAVREVTMSLAAAQEGGWMPAIVGIVTLFIGSTAVFAELQSALNLIWDVQQNPERGWVRTLVRVRVRSFALAMSVGFLLLVSLVLSAGISAASELLNSRYADMAWLWRFSDSVTGFVVAMLLFAMIYKYLPDVTIHWRDVWIGAAVTAGLFTLGKWAIGVYLGQAAPGSAYGAAGSFAVLLIWVYYSALICFLGAEFTQVYARRYGSRIHPKPYAQRQWDKSDTL